MSRVILLSLVFAWIASANAASRSDAELSASVQWHMSLDATGQITVLEAQGKPIDVLREKLEPAVREWKFEPGTINGKPAATDTVLSVQVVLVPIAGTDDLSVHVLDVRTGGGLLASKSSPHFPKGEMRRMAGEREEHVERVVLSISYDASGAPLDVSAIADASSKVKSLVDAAISSARDWKIDPERVAGVGIAGTLVSPLCFFTAKSISEANRKSEMCAWHMPETSAVLSQGQSVTLDSSVKLKSEVIGSTL